MAGRAPRIGLLPAPRGGGPRGRFAVVAGRFNEAVSKRLLELAQAARALAATGRFAAIVCVGVVIKGATPHFEYVSAAAAQGITHAALATGVPISFGVITALTEEQAWERAGGSVGNRGKEAALASIEMAEFVRATHTRGGRRSASRRG